MQYRGCEVEVFGGDGPAPEAAPRRYCYRWKPPGGALWHRTRFGFEDAAQALAAARAAIDGQISGAAPPLAGPGAGNELAGGGEPQTP